MYRIERGEIFSIPNLLSLLRIALIPVVISVYVRGHVVAAGVLLIFSALTDTADGIIARRFNQITNLGKMLDPIADKLTQFCIAFCLCFSHNALIPLAIILAVKELMMGVLGLKLLKSGKKPFGARWWGKVATFVFYVAAIIIMMFGNRMPRGAVWAISLSVMAVLAYSMWRYLLMYRQLLKEG